MKTPPIIIVAGGGLLYVELLERLGNRCCRTIHCETQGQALDRAADAAVVIVNLDVAGGAALLCRRLRAEPSTASVPIILRAPSEQRVPDVDRRVEIDDFERLIQAIQHCVPSLAEAAATMISEQDDAADLFDVESHTGTWRWAEESETWPPAAPSAEGQDALDFTRDYAGYVNSLLEAHGFIDQLSAAELERLEVRCSEVLQRMHEVLDRSQTAINDALKRAQLQRMHEISAARNVLYEKLRQLRSVHQTSTHPSGEPTAPRPAMSQPAAAREPIRPARAPTPANTPAIELAEHEAQPKESEITRAARAKEAERRRQQDEVRKLAPPRPESRRKRLTGSARRAGPQSRTGVIVAVVSVVALAVVGLTLLAPTLSSPPAQPHRNQPPMMQHVVLQQIDDAVVVRATAVDPDDDPISYIIRWRVNRQLVRAASSPRIESRFYEAGDELQVEVTPSDGFANGAPMLSQPLRVE